MKKLYYMVGIKGRDMPNREDWYHYLDCIYASNPDEAVKAYFKQKRNRFEDLDKELIEVYDVLLPYEEPLAFALHLKKLLTHFLFVQKNFVDLSSWMALSI